MQYKKFNIAKKGRKYTDKQTGEEKTYWDQVGILTEFTDEQTGRVSRIISIPAIGLEANIFPIEPKPQQGGYVPAPRGTAPYQPQAAQKVAVNPALAPGPAGTEEINIADIPF